MPRPMLDDLELEQVQVVDTDEDQVATRHRVPGLEGDFWQVSGRRSARLDLTGVLTAPDTVDSLGKLRDKFHAGEPVSFVSDITSATLVDKVLIEQMDVRELAGRPSAFEYRFGLLEFIEATRIDTEDVVIPPPPPPEVTTGKLSVTVVVDGEPGFDMDRVRVTAHGTEDETGAEVNRTLTNRTASNVWFEDPFPAGNFTVDALVDDTATPTGQREVLTGSATAHVQNGPVTSVTIILRRGAKIGTVFVVHFQFDKAFVEPCMRHVLQQVTEHATAHADERLLISGHTDLVGSASYNQALSERRARSVFAMMTFGSNPQASVAEWNELRRARTAGTITTVKDTWGTREIQFMLQDLGLYAGNVGVSTGEDASLTDAAIRQFQHDHGLTEDGVVGDDTWPVLIEAYLGNEPIDLPVAQLLPNANDSGCDSGPLRWVGCSETDPVLNTEDAWRPNRRVELMFVHEAQLPCQVPKPITLDQVPDGAGGGGWCLDDGTATSVHCFVVPWNTACPTGPPDPRRPWCRQPAETGSFEVRGRIHFEDGTPLVNGSYVLIAADGEYMDDEVRSTGSDGTHAGTPFSGHTDADGNFVHHQRQVSPPAGQPAPTPGRKGPGTYTLSVDGPFVVSAGAQSLDEVKGNTVCFRLDGSADADIVVTDRAVAFVRPSIDVPTRDAPAQPPPVPPQPSVTVKDAIVIVPKPSTHPARRKLVLKASTAFTGSGTFTLSKQGTIRFFDAAAAGSPVASGATFTSAQLQAGVDVFAEAVKVSDKLGDVDLTLQLTVDGKKGLAAKQKMTAVELFLDLHGSRTSTTTLPTPLAGAAKMNPGRFVHLQDVGGFHHGRALLTVRPPKPTGFTGPLVLQSLDAATATPRERLFAAAFEVAAAGQPTQPLKVTIPNVPAAGVQFWVEGARVSATVRDCGFQLGVDGVEPDGDRVALTVCQFSNLQATVTATPPHSPRLGNAPAAAHVFTVAAANGFDEDPTVNGALPLVENCAVAAAPIALSVDVVPAGTPVRWGAQRAQGIPAAHGGDDAAAIVALHAAAAPTVSPVGGNDRHATMLADNSGTFHVRPFVDGNGNGRFDHHIDREPNMVLNVVLGRATLFLDSSVARSTQFVVAPDGANGINVASGDAAFNIANPGAAAIHMNAQVDVVTGGADGRRSINQFFGGWINNEVAVEQIAGSYRDTVPPNNVHTTPSIFASNNGAATGGGPGNRIFLPGPPDPAIVPPPLLDSGRGAAVIGRGGDSATLGTSRIRPPRSNQAVGQRWIVEAIDSPGDGDVAIHPAIATAHLIGFRFGLTFSATLAVWTNRTAASGGTGDPADRVYAVLERLSWSVNGQWNINPANGAITVVTAPTCTLAGKATTSPAIAAVNTPVEVRFPAGLDLLARNARA